ncbi:MAG: YgaP family membrane protein [Aggregatilineales bacterium]
MAFAKFMAKPAGRIIRIVAGIVLVVIGLAGVLPTNQALGIVIAVIGVVPILAGVLNVCLIAPIIGAPFSGRKALES